MSFCAHFLRSFFANLNMNNAAVDVATAELIALFTIFNAVILAATSKAHFFVVHAVFFCLSVVFCITAFRFIERLVQCARSLNTLNCHFSKSYFISFIYMDEFAFFFFFHSRRMNCVHAAHNGVVGSNTLKLDAYFMLNTAHAALILFINAFVFLCNCCKRERQRRYKEQFWFYLLPKPPTSSHA